MDELQPGRRLHSPTARRRWHRSVTLAMFLLSVSAGSEAAAQPGDLFRAVELSGAVGGRGFQPPSDSATLRQRLVSVDLGLIAPPLDGTDSASGPTSVLTLNLFEDVSFTARMERSAPTFSGGFALSGRLSGIETGTVTLVVNGGVLAGTVRTPEATYRIRSVGNGLHAVSQIDPERLPPLGEPIRR